MTHGIPLLDKENKTAWIHSNGEKILFEPLFGYRQYVPMPDSKYKLSTMKDIFPEFLGQAVRWNLEHSRVLDRSEINDFFDNDRLENWYKECTNRMIRLFGVKTKSALYKTMMQCPINIRNGILHIRPTKHDRSDIYSGISLNDKEVVQIPLTSSDEAIGQALKLAFTRCTGVGAFEFHKKLKELGWE